MIVLIDTDVLLDVALDRAPHAVSAAGLLDVCERKSITGFVAWHTVSNVYYLLQPSRGQESARRFIVELLGFIEVAPTDSESLRYAARLAMTDLEDAMQVAAATACGAELILTRNLRDFRRSPIRATTPAAFLRDRR